MSLTLVFLIKLSNVCSIIVYHLIFLYCFGTDPPNLSPKPDARIATANLLFFFLFIKIYDILLNYV